MPSQETSNKYGPGWRGPRFLWQGQRRWALLELTGQLAELVRLRVPLGDGISAMALDAPNRKMRALLFVLGLELKNGLSLHETFARRPNFFPDFYVDAVRVGEETGRLPDMLIKIADTYDTEVDAAVDGLTSIIEPVLIIVLAVVVGTIVIAMFMPLVSIISNLK